MRIEIESVDRGRAARVGAVLYGSLGALVAVVGAAFWAAEGVFALITGEADVGSRLFTMSLIYFAVSVILGAIFGWVLAWAYNLAAPRIGGLRLDVRPLAASDESNVYE